MLEYEQRVFGTVEMTNAYKILVYDLLWEKTTLKT
jgi:hypothetical protein